MGQNESSKTSASTLDHSSDEKVEPDESKKRNACLKKPVFNVVFESSTAKTLSDAEKEKVPNKEPEGKIDSKVELKIGSLSEDIRKHYCFRDVIGIGHYGKVRVAYRKENPKRLYAVKSINKKKLSKREHTKLLKEVEILSNLDHQNIIKFHETYQDEFYFHIVMDLCKGKELLSNIVKEGLLTETKVCRIVHQVLSATAYYHSINIVHRDLKPENLVFESEDIDSDIKIIDFGLSCKFKPSLKMNTILGTPYYIAPEVLKGCYDEKCDIWSIGAIAYLMLTGEPPFKGECTMEIFKSICNRNIKFTAFKGMFTDEAISFLEKCLNKDPKKRPSAHEALTHPWFDRINKETHSSKNLHTDVLENLRKFSEAGDLKKMVLNYLIKNVSTEEIKSLKETFNAMDTDQTGRLRLNELEEGFRQSGIEIKHDEIIKVFDKVNVSHCGNIDYTEFLIASIDKSHLVNKEQLVKAFQHFDFDQSGMIDRSDLEKALLCEGHTIVHRDDLVRILHEASQSDKETISLAEFLSLFGY